MNQTQLPPDSEAEETLEGIIERITFTAPDTGWTVAKLKVVGRHEPVTIVGSMLGPEVGESLRLFGSWQQHATYGKQFRFERYQLVRPSTSAGIWAYLSGGLVEGIGPKLAEKLVRHFGENTLEILDRKPERIREVDGIGQVRAKALEDAWRRHQSMHRIMVFLHEHGVGSTLAARIHARYADQAIEILEREPYTLARDIRGIGFLTADRIARQAGIAEDDPARLEAGLLHLLDAATGQGHLYLPRPMLIEKATSLLEVPEQNVEMALLRLIEAEEVSEERLDDEVAVYATRLLSIEQEVAGMILDLTRRVPDKAPDLEHVKAWLSRRKQMGETDLSDEQERAVATALGSGMCVITGGPGTGKTTVTRAIVDGLQSLGRSVALASPTGRAAKRLQQVAGHEAKTIHRMLSYDPFRGGFKHGPEEPLEANVVILDEASMLDIMLARSVLRALPKKGQLILVGDADQLPSVGPGNVLRDVVDSGAVTVCRLTQIFRQAEGSDIVQSAHALNRGESPGFASLEQWRRTRGDCLLIEEDDVQKAADRVILAATSNLPKMGFGPHDIQVITPLRRGPLGVSELNARLQERLNPEAGGRTEVRRGDTVFRQGDRVLQTINNYDRGVYNGDIGFIAQIESGVRTLTVEFDLGRVQYEFGDLDELELAYALTVHKSQGSEYPAAVIVIHSTHYIMLQRNLLYTALTRAQKMACVVGNQRGIWRAINNVTERDRFTRLAARLRGEPSPD